MVVTSNIEFWYSEGPATIGSLARPANGGTPQQKGIFSIGGAPKDITNATNQIPAYDAGPPRVNLQALFDDTLEADNEGTSGSTIDHRCIYVRNNSTQTDVLNSTLYRARLYGQTDNLDDNTRFEAAVLPINGATGIPTDGTPADAQTLASEGAAPAVQVTGSSTTTALTWRAVPVDSVISGRVGIENTRLFLNTNPANTIDLPKDRFVGIWLRRTVTKVASPVGRIEEFPITVFGGSPSNV